MENLPSSWEQEKLEAYRRLAEDLEIGYLDTDILDILIEFFARPRSYTKSSCSGRITIMDSKYPWIKSETNIIFKKHEKIASSDIVALLRKPFKERLWLRIQGPIYHVYSLNLEEAYTILKIAQQAGFKHSGVLSLQDNKIVVELRTGIEASIPLKDNKTKYIEEENIESIIDLANTMLEEAKKRNKKLKTILEKNRPEKLWDKLYSIPELVPIVNSILKRNSQNQPTLGRRSK